MSRDVLPVCEYLCNHMQTLTEREIRSQEESPKVIQLKRRILSILAENYWQLVCKNAYKNHNTPRGKQFNS